MDLNRILSMVGQMFPSANLSGAVEKAQEAISGTADSLEGVRAAAGKLGIDAGAINQIYNKYGRTMQARAVCGLLGTTPEALKADADRIVGGTGTAFREFQGQRAAMTTKFPRLK